jgi:type IV pilus assembly protein PilN
MITINLLPVREERRKAWARQFLGIVLIAVAASAGLSLTHYWWYRGEVQSAKDVAASIQRDIDAFAPQLAQVEKFRAAKADIEKKLKVIDELSLARSGPVHLFDEIATHLPDRMWLTHMDVKGQALRIEGVSLDNELVALFLTAMNASPYFEEVELLQTQAKEFGGYKLNAFELSATLSSQSGEAAGAGVAADSQHAQAGARSATAFVAR